jgi:hypothetical protein
MLATDYLFCPPAASYECSPSGVNSSQHEERTVLRSFVKDEININGTEPEVAQILAVRLVS